MNSNSINGWHLEPTFRKLELIDKTLTTTIAVALSIPMDTLVDIFKVHDCGRVDFTCYPNLAQRDYAQAVLGAIFGILDNPPQPGPLSVVDLRAMDVMRSIITTTLLTRASDLQIELRAVQEATHDSKRIATRRNMLERRE